MDALGESHSAGETVIDYYSQSLEEGRGLYSMLDAFPFQDPGAPDQAVSIPLAESLFGQGASGEFSEFKITTVSN